MNISEACIRRPVMTTLITASLIVFGIFGYRLLSVAALPRVDFPTIQVTATLPGASPETMAASVAGPIERQFSTIAGITSMTSTSSLGQSQITIQFDLKREIDGAALDVQTALAIAQRRLPIEMTTPPSFRKVNPGDQPVLFISLISPTLPMSTVDEYGQTILAQQISQLPGVAQVQVFGSQKFAVRIQVDPVAAAARSISLDDIRTVLTKANSNTPVGTLSGADRTVTLLASGAMRRAADYRPVVAAWRNGAPVYAVDFSINNMTLLALTLSVGFVVDDAIVMLENIVRHIEGGMRPFEAALKGSREIGFTIVSITFSLIAVFIPVLLMGGIVGRVFREFAVTIAIAIVVSGFVSLTLTPMLCARVLRGHHAGEQKKPVWILRV